MSRKDDLIVRIAKKFPDLPSKLRQARINKTPEKFIVQVFVSSLYTTIVLLFIVALLFSKADFLVFLLVFLAPFLFCFLLMYFLQLPTVKAKLVERAIEREVVYAGRFLVIELESGISLYKSFSNIVKNYPEVGKVFRQIVQSVDLGSDMQDAINDAVDSCPSRNLRKMLIQVKNSLRSGADVSASLGETINQITQEQIIAVKEYGRKLNPFVMFFMMTGVIMPSLGATAFIVLASFLTISVDLPILLLFVGCLAFVQFSFLNLIRASRPPVEI